MAKVGERMPLVMSMVVIITIERHRHGETYERFTSSRAAGQHAVGYALTHYGGID